jgi:predicted HTH domain antitoxin
MKSSVREIKIELPEDVFLSASISEKQLAQEMREVVAFKLYSEGRLSGGTAAKLAGMPRVAFLLKAGQQNIEWLPHSKDEVRRELS